MGFVNSGDSYTLDFSLTDYGKALLTGGLGQNLFGSIKQFGLKDMDIDYRRFSADTSACGPQNTYNSPTNERLSGSCYYSNYPDIRGRASADTICNEAVFVGPRTINPATVDDIPSDATLHWKGEPVIGTGGGCFDNGFNAFNVLGYPAACDCYPEEWIEIPTNTTPQITWNNLSLAWAEQYIIKPAQYTYDGLLPQAGVTNVMSDFDGNGSVDCNELIHGMCCFYKNLTAYGMHNYYVGLWPVISAQYTVIGACGAPSPGVIANVCGDLTAVIGPPNTTTTTTTPTPVVPTGPQTPTIPSGPTPTAPGGQPGGY
tara:strand:- start:20766 stop:21710 length:945 start_codon:yes stop_codon:yes gene_type:complete